MRVSTTEQDTDVTVVWSWSGRSRQPRGRWLLPGAPCAHVCAHIASELGVMQAQCRDVPSWDNGPRPGGPLTCVDYARRGYCAAGAFRPSYTWTGGASFNHPERSCCICGRQAVDVQPTRAPLLEIPAPPPLSNASCRCAGISLCTPAGLGSFMLRMPREVSEHTSPWYSYLQAVYRQRAPLPLPLRLSHLEAFYPALLPTAPCTLSSHLHAASRLHAASHSHHGDSSRRVARATGSSAHPACAASRCAEWLPTPPPTAAAVASFIANRTYIRVAARADDDSRAYGHIVVLQKPTAEREPLGETRWGPRATAIAQPSLETAIVPAAATSSRRRNHHEHAKGGKGGTGTGEKAVSKEALSPLAPSLVTPTWVEVTRSIYPGEGTHDYGCWLHPAAGTGVFVRLTPSRTLTWAHRGVAHSAVVAWSHHPPGGKNRDGDLPRLAASRGWQAIEILSSHRRPAGWQELGPTDTPARELILMDSTCMKGAEGLATGCVPVAMRTGWHPRAARECGCDGTQYPEVLNCAATDDTSLV